MTEEQTLTIQQAIDLALQHHTAGDLPKAEGIYQQILQADPNQPVALHLLGLIAHEVGKNDIAIDLITKAISIQPDYAEAHSNLGNVLKDLGNLDGAAASYSMAITIKPDSAEVHSNLGVVLQELGEFDESLASCSKALIIDPNYAEAHYNLGITFQALKQLDEAVASYSKAIEIKPDYAEAHSNLGNVLKDLGKLDAAVTNFNKAIIIKPDYAGAHYNLGITLNVLGKYDEAVASYNQAIAINPDYTEANSNLGNALQELGKSDEALASYSKALAIKPDYVDAAWNAVGTASSITEAQNWVERCLLADASHENAKLTLAALKAYQGDRTDFENLIESSDKDHPYVRSFIWAFSLPKLPSLYFNRWVFFDAIIKKSQQSRPFYEFGVWRGEAFKYLIKTFKKGYGFDTFEGLPEDWHLEKAGNYSSNGNIPEIEGGKFVIGKFEDSLPVFFSEPRPMASVINFDADLYSSTICALNYSKPVIDQHTILIFDEFIMNENWEQDEFKALVEFCENKNHTYEVVAISFFTKQVAVKLIGM
jgi:tetratricopeptide (TPR) repeat protein